MGQPASVPSVGTKATRLVERRDDLDLGRKADRGAGERP
jgi:hypothetical protein